MAATGAVAVGARDATTGGGGAGRSQAAETTARSGTRTRTRNDRCRDTVRLWPGGKASYPAAMIDRRSEGIPGTHVPLGRPCGSRRHSTRNETTSRHHASAAVRHLTRDPGRTRCRHGSLERTDRSALAAERLRAVRLPPGQAVRPLMTSLLHRRPGVAVGMGVRRLHHLLQARTGIRGGGRGGDLRNRD